MVKKHIDSEGDLSILGPCAFRIYRQLERDIGSADLQAGAKLPTEKELCQRFRASRSSVRTALKQLSRDGLIISRQGSGSYVQFHEKAEPRIKTISVMYHGILETVQSIQNMILGEGCIMSLFSQRTQGWQPELEKRFLEQVMIQRHTALLASCTPLRPTNGELLQALHQAGIRIIHIEPYGTKLPAEGYFMPDYRRAGYAAAVDLMLSGCENIVFGTMKDLPPYALLLKQGFIAAANDHKREVRFIEHEKLTGRKLNSLVRSGTSGLFICSYQCGLKLGLDLAQTGLDSPEKTQLLTVEMTGDIINPDSKLDYITFSRLKHIKQVVSMVLDDSYQTPKELIPPEIVKF